MLQINKIVKLSTIKPELQHLCINLAKKSDAPRKMSAILLDKRNKVISTGVNSYVITHTQQFYAAVIASKKFRNPSLASKIYLHCEINCLLRARRPGYKLVICGIGGHGGSELRDSFCCPICYHYIRTNCTSIKEIHWSTSDQNFKYIKL